MACVLSMQFLSMRFLSMQLLARHRRHSLRCLLALGFALFAIVAATVRIQAQEADAPTLFRIHFATPAQLERLVATVDVWEVDHAAGYALAALTTEEERSVAQAGYALVPDATRTAQLRALAQPDMPQDSTTGLPGFACYRTVEETYAGLEALSITYPKLARWIDIGDSWRKEQSFGAEGYDLRALVISNQASDAPKAVFYLLAAVHARELTTAETATRFGEYLVRHYGRDADITWLLDHTEIHIVPLGNPDGRKQAEAGFLWRKNMNNTDGCYSSVSFGVDLNRNGSFRWRGCGSGACSSGDPCGITYRGSAAGSEPETQALEAYARAIFDDQRNPGEDDAAPLDASGLFISLHSYGELVLFPWGWTTKQTPNATELQTLGRKFGFFNGHAVCQVSQPDCLYRADGTNDDFVYGELGVASYTFELGDFFFEGCTAFEETIWPTNLPALLYAAKAARQPYRTPRGPDVIQLRADAMPVASGSEVQVHLTLDDTRYASNGYGDEPVQPVGGGRYSLNAPSWLRAPVNFDVAPTDAATATTTLTISTAGLDVGRHMLFVEGVDAEGNVGPPSALFLDVASGQRAFVATAPTTLTSRLAATLQISVSVTNTGELADQYRVLVTDSPWPVTLSSDALPLGPGESGALVLEAAMSSGDQAATAALLHFTVYSAQEPWLREELAVAVEGKQHRLFFPLVGR